MSYHWHGCHINVYLYSAEFTPYFDITCSWRLPEMESERETDRETFITWRGYPTADLALCLSLTLTFYHWPWCFITDLDVWDVGSFQLFAEFVVRLENFHHLPEVHVILQTSALWGWRMQAHSQHMYTAQSVNHVTVRHAGQGKQRSQKGGVTVWYLQLHNDNACFFFF